MMGSQLAPAAAAPAPSASDASASDRIVDVHLHFDEKIPTFLDDFLRVSDKLNLTWKTGIQRLRLSQKAQMLPLT